MRTKSIVVDDSPGLDVNPKFTFGEIVHISPIPICLHRFLHHDPDTMCIVDEYPGQPPFFEVWFRKRFVPLSDIDETKIERNYNLGQVEVFNRILPRFKAKNRK